MDSPCGKIATGFVCKPLPLSADAYDYHAQTDTLLIATMAMMFSTFVQVILWGVLFVWLGEFTELYEAVYHSAVNFASLGYGDIVMQKQWRLLGPLEAINGVMMLGLSVAALTAVLQNIFRAQNN